MKKISAFLFLVMFLSIALYNSCEAQGRPKKQTGKKLQIGVITTLAASSLTMEKMPAYMPITGVGLFGVGFVLDLKQNRKNPKMKKVKLVRI